MALETPHGKILVGAYDLTAAHTNLGLTLTQDAIDDVCMLADGAGTGKLMQSVMPGLKQFAMSMSGFTIADTDEANGVLDAAFGAAGTIITMTGYRGESGDPAYSAYSTLTEHEELGGSVGGMSAFAAAAAGQGSACFRGTILGTGAKTETGNGTGYQLGAITAGTNALYAALHVVSITGSDITLNVDLYSAAASNFVGATKRLSFTQVATTITSEIKSLATAVTDTWWRATWTIEGTASYTIALNAGIITL